VTFTTNQQTTGRENTISDLVVVMFKDETTTFEMRAALAKMQIEYLIDMEHEVVATKDAKEDVKLPSGNG